jgi:hypothetical protein
MKLRITTLLGTTAAAAFIATSAFAGAAPFPAFSAAVTPNASPLTFDMGILGKDVTVGGVVSGYAQVQSNHVPGDLSSTVDLSNAQIFINKSDGVFQYFIQAGTYSLPNLSTFAYNPSSKTPAATFGNLPQGFIKIVPNSSFSFEVGALPTLVGDEYTFTFENLNIERGLLWGMEPAVSRGVQANFAQGPISLSVAWTDGFYSNKFNTVSGLGTWTIDGSNILAADFQIPTSKNNTFTSVTNPFFNNESIYNIMYTHTMGPWIINPYVQYTSLDTLPLYGNSKETTWGAALLVNYTFDSKSALAGFSLPFRVEYISASGTPSTTPDLTYGADSNAWSFTITPTYQYKQYFVRAELSYVTVNKLVPGDGYGQNLTDSSQTRGLIETGVAF